MKVLGEPFRGEVNGDSTGASAVLTLYKDGSLTAYTLLGDEYLEIHSCQIISVAGGDTMIFIGADGTPGAGEYVVRGTVPANGGIVMESIDPPHVGAPGHLPYGKAPTGVWDAIVRGGIRREGDGSSSARESWKAASN